MMVLNFVHMTEAINIKARHTVTALQLLLVCASQVLFLSSVFYLIGDQERSSTGGRNGCPRLKVGDIFTSLQRFSAVPVSASLLGKVTEKESDRDKRKQAC